MRNRAWLEITVIGLPPGTTAPIRYAGVNTGSLQIQNDDLQRVDVEAGTYTISGDPVGRYIADPVTVTVQKNRGASVVLWYRDPLKPLQKPRLIIEVQGANEAKEQLGRLPGVHVYNNDRRRYRIYAWPDGNYGLEIEPGSWAVHGERAVLAKGQLPDGSTWTASLSATTSPVSNGTLAAGQAVHLRVTFTQSAFTTRPPPQEQPKCGEAGQPDCPSETPPPSSNTTPVSGSGGPGGIIWCILEEGPGGPTPGYGSINPPGFSGLCLGSVSPPP